MISNQGGTRTVKRTMSAIALAATSAATQAALATGGATVTVLKGEE